MIRKNIFLLLLTTATIINAEDLKTVVQEVLTTSPRILERLKNYNAIKENVTTAEADYYPKLNLSIGIGHEQTKNKIAPNTGSNNGKFDYKIYQNSLVYTQNIFKGFQTKYRVKEQENIKLSAAYSYIEQIDTIAFEMVNTYLLVIKNTELLKNADENRKITKDILQKVQKLYDAGLTTLSEVNKIQAAYSLAQSNYVVQENTLLDFTYNMNRALGRSLDYEKMSKPKLNIAMPKTMEDAIEYAMRHNPSILVQDYNIKVAQATYKELQSPFYPSVDLEISQSFNQKVSLFSTQNDTFRAMATLSYNLFNGFADKAARQKNISLIHQDVQIKNKLRREAIEGLSLSWAAYKKLGEQLTYLKEYRKFSEETLKLYSKEYDLGRRSLLDLLSAQNDFIGSKSQIINTEFSWLYAKYRILDAMGTLVSTVVGAKNIAYENVGLANHNYEEEDTLPISFDRDKDLIPDAQDICQNSLLNKLRNEHGCRQIYEDTIRIERYSGFLFKDESATLTSEGQRRLGALIKQVKPYGFKYLKFDLLGNVDSEDMSKDDVLKLSNQRAKIVKEKLLAAGALAENIIIHAKADIAPLFSNETANGIRLNNRVDIAVEN
jgi:adhesin transport system outer membrane protein